MSQATRAYLHAEKDVEAALNRAGFTVTKRELHDLEQSPLDSDPHLNFDPPITAWAPFVRHLQSDSVDMHLTRLFLEIHFKNVLSFANGGRQPV